MTLNNFLVCTEHLSGAMAKTETEVSSASTPIRLSVKAEGPPTEMSRVRIRHLQRLTALEQQGACAPYWNTHIFSPLGACQYEY